MRILVDEMYPHALADSLWSAGIEAVTVADLRLAGTSDEEVFDTAIVGGYAILSENVGDFARIAAEHSAAGSHHPGVLIALSSRFSRRPAGMQSLSAAIQAIQRDLLDDRVVYLEQPRDE